MRFRNYDKLRNFARVARCASFTEAANHLNLTKGAISHQMDGLESELGFSLFNRGKRGIELTVSGHRLLSACDLAFDRLEQEIGYLRRQHQSSITIGMATYFASRWLSPRLMDFISHHSGIGLRLQPMVGIPDFPSNDLDMAIRWGKGDWVDPGMTVELIFPCPAMLTVSREMGQRIESQGIEAVLSELNFLHDTESNNAWVDWFDAAGLGMQTGSNDLFIPDPNVRFQAVIDGQGAGLYDTLIDDEVAAGKVYRYEAVQLHDYGYYLIYPEAIATGSPLRVFRDWIMHEAMRNIVARQ